MLRYPIYDVLLVCSMCGKSFTTDTFIYDVRSLACMNIA